MKKKNSPRTCRVDTLDISMPSEFSATHSYLPWSSSSLLVICSEPDSNRIITTDFTCWSKHQLWRNGLGWAGLGEKKKKKKVNWTSSLNMCAVHNLMNRSSLKWKAGRLHPVGAIGASSKTAKWKTISRRTGINHVIGRRPVRAHTHAKSFVRITAGPKSEASKKRGPKKRGFKKARAKEKGGAQK